MSTPEPGPDGPLSRRVTFAEKEDERDRAARRAPPESCDDAILWMTLNLAFFFLLRAGEYCKPGEVDLDRVLRGVDVSQQNQGKWARHGTATETVVHFRKQKSDQVAFGMNRTQYETKLPLCVVDAVERVRGLMPERFDGGAQAHLPLCRWSHGAMVRREEVQNVLQKAGAGVGLPPDRFKTHSLRIGGASALYHATGEIEVVKRYGRWTSGAFHGYLWDSAEQYRTVAKKMPCDGRMRIPRSRTILAVLFVF